MQTALEVIQNCRVESNVVKLPAVQLDSKLYGDVKLALTRAGGKWKGGKVNGFVFALDPTEHLRKLQAGEKVNLKQQYQFFGTPDDLADDIVNACFILEGSRICEPHGGQGALIKALRRNYNFHEETVVDTFEPMPENRQVLAGMPHVNLIGEDFLACTEPYDVFIANPPFTGDQDIDHIRHMYSLLNPNGFISTLASTSWQYGKKAKHQEFRDWLDEVGAVTFPVPRGAFSKSGTSVETVRIYIKA